ncbi:MAG TPA: VOC family protein [Acidisoma sp.]|uniref:VOC family protein n=1 Tax=Acidisoma sp. TaxID=1872115 RepID=UPI002C8565DB|nr:VOC family protein [Acidisoma sp.]HTH99695.1 VOC family protein [Acidisoma sp.]
MNPPSVSRFLECALYVADLDCAQVFYERVFGFAVMFRDPRMAALDVPGRQALLLFRIGASDLPSETPFGIVPGHGARGVQHLCFAIPPEGIPDWEAHLAGLAIPIESRVHWAGGGTSLYFRDPDGHSLEVATPGLWRNDPLEV